MSRLLRRLRRAARPEGVTFCEACGQACTATCRSAALADRTRTEALRRALVR